MTILCVRTVLMQISRVVFQKCDVTVWEDQVALFEFAFLTFGAVDIVVCHQASEFKQLTPDITCQIPNAGISSLEGLKPKPCRPNTRVLDINLIGVIYSEQSDFRSCYR